MEPAVPARLAAPVPGAASLSRSVTHGNEVQRSSYARGTIRSSAFRATDIRTGVCAITSPRHRAVRSKGCLSNKTVLAMIFKPADAAERSWRRLLGRSVGRLKS
jgi:hypothetical protein